MTSWSSAFDRRTDERRHRTAPGSPCPTHTDFRPWFSPASFPSRFVGYHGTFLSHAPWPGISLALSRLLGRPCLHSVSARSSALRRQRYRGRRRRPLQSAQRHVHVRIARRNFSAQNSALADHGDPGSISVFVPVLDRAQASYV